MTARAAFPRTKFRQTTRFLALTGPQRATKVLQTPVAIILFLFQSFNENRLQGGRNSIHPDHFGTLASHHLVHSRRQ